MRCQPCGPSTTGFSRRNFLRFGLGASAAAAAGLRLPELIGQDTVAKQKTGKNVILLWMGGGPSQIDTWDPKPGNPKTQGPFKAFDTPIRGMQLSEHMEKIGAQAKNLALLRSVTTKEAAH